MLCDVVAKGGNLLLNVGPDADGNLPREALQRMEAIGKWLEKNGYAIYGTRPLYPYCEGNVRYTQSKDGKHQYAITEAYDKHLRDRLATFRHHTKCKAALHLTFITTFGLTKNKYWSNVQSEVVMDDVFVCP